MGLFKKEACALCGGKAGMFDKKIVDGKICKSCAEQLSPWFDDFKQSDSTLLDAQITSRKAGEVFLPDLKPTKVFGDRGVILIDEEKEQFVCVGDTSTSLFGSQKKVTCIEDVLEFKPDILKFEQIEDVGIHIVETSREEKLMIDGEMRSHDPQEFTYMITFYLEINLSHPYVKRVYFPLNDGSVQIRNVGRRVWTDPGRRIAAHLLNMPGLIVENQAAYYDNDSLLDLFYHSPYEMPEYSYGFRCSHANLDDIRRYHYYLYMAQAIQESLHWKEF